MMPLKWCDLPRRAVSKAEQTAAWERFLAKHPGFMDRLAESREELLHVTAVRRMRDVGLGDNPHAVNREVAELRKLLEKYK